VPIQVVVPLSTVLGGSAPGELAGWGVLDPDACRELALDGAFRRWVADPLTGELLDVGAHEYVPSEQLRRFVIARDRTCTWPNCNRLAVQCDLDHRVSFRGDKKLRNRKGKGRKHKPTGRDRQPIQDGLTVRANLGPLCRRHHRVKHQTEWTIERLADGAVLWTSPYGATYVKPVQRYLEADDLLAASGAGSPVASGEGHPPPDTPHLPPDTPHPPPDTPHPPPDIPLPPPQLDPPRSNNRRSDPWWPPEEPPSPSSDAPPF
jgi:hypothetical protein